MLYLLVLFVQTHLHFGDWHSTLSKKRTAGGEPAAEILGDRVLVPVYTVPRPRVLVATVSVIAKNPKAQRTAAAT